LGDVRTVRHFPIGLAVSEVKHLGLFTGIIRDISERKKLQREVSASPTTNSVASARTCTTARNRNLPAWECWRRRLLRNLARRPAISARLPLKHCELAKKILDGIARTHQEVQTISRGLVPVRLDDEGLMDALRELGSRTDELEGVTCAFKCEQPVEVAESLTATHLYRIAQEAVTNA
jgi:signal transduction histidine kinase